MLRYSGYSEKGRTESTPRYSRYSENRSMRAALLDGGLTDDAARRAAQGAGGVGALAGGAGGAEVVGVLGGVLGGTGAAFGALGGAGALGLASARAARPDSGLDHNVGCDSATVCVAITPYCNGHARREGGGLSQQRKRI
jgi:hypothetical protein